MKFLREPQDDTTLILLELCFIQIYSYLLQTKLHVRTVRLRLSKPLYYKVLHKEIMINDTCDV